MVARLLKKPEGELPRWNKRGYYEPLKQGAKIHRGNPGSITPYSSFRNRRSKGSACSRQPSATS